MSMISGYNGVLLLQTDSVTGQAKIRICMVSEAQSNVEGIARLETLASGRNTGFGIAESHRCADAQQVIGRC